MVSSPEVRSPALVLVVDDYADARIIVREILAFSGFDVVEAATGPDALRTAQDERPDVILIGTGSEVSVAVEARTRLAERDVDARVVSLPSWEIFRAQDEAWRNEVLPPDVRVRVAVEAGIRMGWSEWIGEAGGFVGMSSFGASAPADDLFEHFGITAEAVEREALRLMAG
ncbi:MAG: transketolase-like TK C-terminal-containing protein [Gemmatimonadota bacterium]